MIMLRLLAFEPTQLQTNQPEPSSQAAPEQNSAGRANALRDILNKNKPAQSNTPQTQPTKAAEPEVSQPDNSQTQLEQSSVQSQPKIVDTPVISDEQAQRQSEDDAYMQHSDVEQTIAAQYDDVMSSAVDQGFNPELANATSNAEQSASSMGEQEARAQSAIARILRDRNISGAGKLSSAAIEKPTEEKPVPTKSEFSRPVSNEAQTVSQQPPPWDNEVSDDLQKKPQLPAQGSRAQVANKPASKVDFKAKHQTITENLAPELLEQINPQKPAPVVEQEPSIPVPDDFQSPISEIRFAHQQDEWAYLIKRMGLGGRMRQFALHSIFTKQDNHFHIEVDESQKHLDTPMLRQKLNVALSSIYGHNVELNIDFASGVIDSPYLIQQKIDAGRHQQAIDVITSDENIVQFQQLFSAEIDENSIQAL
jgi:DNA polymerase-3 subunit gamma/tau